MTAQPDLALLDASDLDAALARSEKSTVLLFKHSTACPVSAHARVELQRFLGERKDGAPFVALVRVIEERSVSKEIERRVGVKHESPQAIVVRGGVAVATLSHGDITAEALRNATK